MFQRSLTHFQIHNLSKNNSQKIFINTLGVLILLFLLSDPALLAQSPTQIDRARVKLEKFPEIYLSIPANAFDSKISALASLDYFDNRRAFLYVNRQALELLISRQINFRLEISPGSVAFDVNMLDLEDLSYKDLAQEWDFYPTYDAYVGMMYQFETQYPDLVKIHQIGTTVQGRALLFAQIKPQIDQPGAVPQFMYTSTMHGDETTGFILSLRLIYHLISNYGSDDEITTLMNQVEIWICPNENPDGTYTNNNSTVSGATRSNANGKDLNRNYPSPHPDYANPPEMPIQPETQAMMDFVTTKNFIMSANLHGGIELVNYPYDSWTSSQKLHADNQWWQFVANEYVDTVHAYSTTGYFTGLETGVTHGGDWYVVYGSRQDYMNYFHSCREFTLELSGQKLLDPDLLPAHWEYNYRSLINYIRQATYGIHGMVKASTTDKPLDATVTLIGHDAFNSEVSTSLPSANFNRPVYAGEYDVAIVAEGYPVAEMNRLKVHNYQTINLNVYLGENTHPLYVFASDHKQGSVIGAGIYPHNLNVTIEAIPNPNYFFLYWTDTLGNILSQEQVYTFDMPAVATYYVAVFEEIQNGFAVLYNTGTGLGTVSAHNNNVNIPSGFIADAGSDILFTAIPSEGYQVESWRINDTLVPDYTLMEYVVEDLKEDIYVVVSFVQTNYLLTVLTSDENAGEVIVSPDSITFHYGQNISLLAVPAAGFTFDAWTDGGENIISQNDAYSFSMPAHDLEIMAVFKVLSSITDLTNQSMVKVFPNPAQNQLTIEADFEMHAIEILDESGRVIMRSAIAYQSRTRVSLAGINTGLYLLRVMGKNGAVVKKLQVL